MEQLSNNRCFGGAMQFFKHASTSTQTDMTFAVYLPPQASAQTPVPVLYWLSGLTCTAENFTFKAGAQRFAAAHGVMLVMPDTSPRGAGVPGEDESYDLGTGAGFYVNATTPGWSTHYKMYDYVVQELPALIKEHFPVTERASIFGHSMGGHGALICALKNPGMYRSVSAFAPIVAPTTCPWGEKAFSAYLGEDRSTWEAYDAHLLIAQAQERLPLLIDQGDADQFLERELHPHRLQAVCEAHGHPLTLRMQEGYDHSYYFIASFIEDHIKYHAAALQAA